jgi:putative restriction endonuclease
MGDDPSTRTFTVACDDIELVRPDLPAEVTEDVKRSYTTQLALRRLHQAAFRRNVLDAYADTCAVCRLKIKGLLDAAHIVGDRHPLGDPVVPNGLALCKIHHAAFDQNIIGIRPDAVVELNAELLEATDGPMLRHGLQEVHRTTLWVPHAPGKRPDPERLEVRYDQFRRAS